jgi:hypothetical protein
VTQSVDDLPEGMRPEWATAAAGKVAALAAEIQYVLERSLAIRKQADTRWSGPDKEAYAAWNDGKFIPTLRDTQAAIQKLSAVIKKNLEEQAAKSKGSNFAIK